MATINELSSADSVEPGDLIPIYKVSERDTRKVSVSKLAAEVAKEAVTVEVFGTLLPEAQVSAVPMLRRTDGEGGEVLNAQAQALLNRVESVRLMAEGTAEALEVVDAELESFGAAAGAGKVGLSASAEYAAGTVGERLKEIAGSHGASFVGHGSGSVADTLDIVALANPAGEYSNFKSTNLSKWRAALARVRAGSGRAKLALVGDSTTAGQGSAGNGTVNSAAASYPSLLANYLNSYHCSAKQGSAWGINLNVNVDPRLTLTAGWGISSTSSVAGSMLRCTSPSTTAASFTPSVAFDKVDIYYATNLGLGTFTVNVDGGATLATVSTNAASAVAKVTVSTSLGIHTVNIARNGTGGNLEIIGFHAYDSSTKSIDVFNMGWPGSKLANWAVSTNGWSPLKALPYVAPDLTVICLTINDATGATDVATYSAGLQSLITAAKLSGDVVLMSGVPSGNGNNQQPYIDALADLSASNDIPLINLTARWQSYAASNALGYYYDTLHPLAIGYYDVAVAVGNKIGSP